MRTIDQAILARWFTKTAVALNVSQPFRLLVDTPTRHALASGVPNNVIVSLYRLGDYSATFDWMQGTVPTWIVPTHFRGPPRLASLVERTYQCQIRVAEACWSSRSSSFAIEI